MSPRRMPTSSCWQVLAGEASGPSGTPPMITVNSLDYISVRGQIGKAVGATNFRIDVNADGAFSALDYIAIRGKISGDFTMTPTCP